MVTIEYDGVKISVPENWKDINLGFYESFYLNKPETARERVAHVATICKTDPDLLLSWPAEVFNRIVSYLDFLFADNPIPPNPTIEINGIKYLVPIEDELSLGAWVDADEAQKAEVNVLSNILAIVCRPVGEEYDYRNTEKRATMFAELPVSEVLGLLAFFLHCKTVLEARTAAYTKMAEAADQLPRGIKHFLNPGDGIRLSQIWLTIRYYILNASLRYHLRKFSPSYSTAGTKIKRKRRNGNKIGS